MVEGVLTVAIAVGVVSISVVTVEFGVSTEVVSRESGSSEVAVSLLVWHVGVGVMVSVVPVSVSGSVCVPLGVVVSI